MKNIFKKKPEKKSAKKTAKFSKSRNSNGGFNVNSILTKLIVLVTIPVVLLVVLGVVSYNKASKAIINNFEEANMSTISKTADYFGLIFDNIVSTSTEIVNNSNLKNYYSKIYKSDLYKEGEAYVDVQKYIFAIGTGNELIKNIYVSCSYGNDIRTSGIASVSKIYDVFAETEEAAAIDAAKRGFYSVHGELDAKGADPDYAFTYARQVYGNSTKPCGYLFMDVEEKPIYDSIRELDMGKGSIVALVLPDGKEIANVCGATPEESVLHKVKDGDVFISNNEFFSEMVASQESDYGYEYVDYNGSKHLFL